MSAVLHNSYIDFLEIAVEAFENKNISIFTKIMVVIINLYKKSLHEIELANVELAKSEKLYFSHNELDNFYDNMYESIDILILLKKQL